MDRIDKLRRKQAQQCEPAKPYQPIHMQPKVIPKKPPKLPQEATEPVKALSPVQVTQKPVAVPHDSSKRPSPGRLPDKSNFELTYDAKDEMWSGSLTVMEGEEKVTFHRKARSAFGILSGLDGYYRKFLKEGARRANPQPEA